MCNLDNYIIMLSGMAVVSTVSKQQGGSGFDPACPTGAFCAALASSPHLCVGYLPQPKDMQMRSAGYSKFPMCVNVSVYGCLSPC